MIKLVELCLISVLVLMLLTWSMYCLCSQQGRCFHRPMISKIRDLTRNFWFDLKRNMAEYLNVVYKLALFALAKSVSGHPDIWKVYWMIGFATFAISCYCLKLFVESKRAELTPASKSLTPIKSEKVRFFTARNALEFLFPLSYLQLAFFYFMELNPINHPMENHGKTLAHDTKIVIDVLAVLLVVVSIIEIRRQAKVEDQFVVDLPELEKGDAKNQLPEVVQNDVKNQSDNYAIRSDVALQMDSGNQSVEEADPSDDVKRQDVAKRMHSFGIDLLKNQSPEVVRKDVENQSDIYASRPDVALQMDSGIQMEVVQKHVNYQEYAYVKRQDVAPIPTYSFGDADSPRVPVHVDDVESQSFVDANQPELALQMDAQNHSVADAGPPEVAIQIGDVENQPEMALKMDVENHSVADADRPGVALQIYDLENQPEVALQMDAENHSAQRVSVSTNIGYLVPAVSVYDARWQGRKQISCYPE